MLTVTSVGFGSTYRPTLNGNPLSINPTAPQLRAVVSAISAREVELHQDMPPQPDGFISPFSTVNYQYKAGASPDAEPYLHALTGKDGLAFLQNLVSLAPSLIPATWPEPIQTLMEAQGEYIPEGLFPIVSALIQTFPQALKDQSAEAVLSTKSFEILPIDRYMPRQQLRWFNLLTPDGNN